MIVITIIEDLYFISHFSRQNASCLVYFFREGFLSKKTLSHIQMLPVFHGKKEAFYSLDDSQDTAVREILQKIMKEKNSGYLFSEDMQRTYLIELIHLITKIHLKAFPPPSASSAN